MVRHDNAAFFLMAQTQIGSPTGGVIPYGIADPGAGKSRVIEAFAKAIGYSCYQLLGTQNDPAEIKGFPETAETVTVYPDGREETKVFVSIVPPKYAVDATEKPTLLFNDELGSCPRAVQAALLSVLTERKIGDMKLPDDTILVAAGNPVESAANGVPLEAPMANRMYHHKWSTPWQTWEQGLLNGLEFPNPEFTKLPASWRTNLPLIGSQVAAFRKRKPEAFEMPKDDNGKLSRSQLSGPWPSMRTWTMYVEAAAAAEAAYPGDESLKRELCEGLVGKTYALEFFEYLDQLDLPDPEAMLLEFMSAAKAGRQADYDHPGRADQVQAMLGAVTARVLADKNRPRWDAACSILSAAASHDKEVSLSCAGPLFRIDEVKDGKWSADEQLTHDVWNLFGRCLEEENGAK